MARDMMSGRINKDALIDMAASFGGTISKTRLPGRAPNVNFKARDLQNADDFIADHPKANVFDGYVTPDEIPQPKLAGGRDAYDWSEIQNGGTYPPPTLMRKKDGTIQILDGNHRLDSWLNDEKGFANIPARIVDYQPEAGPVAKRIRPAKPKPKPEPTIPKSMKGYRVETVESNSWTGQRSAKVIAPNGEVVSQVSGTRRSDAQILADLAMVRGK